MKMFVRVSNAGNPQNSSLNNTYQSPSEITNENIFETNRLPENESFFTNSSGVLQGESLSPFLFSMFINDIENSIKK